MIFNSLKTAYRNLFRNKRNSAIIIFSLATAFTFTNLLLSFITHETNIDSFHQKSERIYRLFSDDPMGGRERIRSILNTTQQYIFQHYPEVEQACTVTALNGNGVVLANDQQIFRDMMVLSVSTSFFKIFDYPFLEGSSMGALVQNGIILSKQTAQKLFGEPPYLNRSIELQQDTVSHLLQVTAVISSEKGRTQFEFDALVPGTDYENSTIGAAFVLLKPGSEVQKLVAKINENDNVPSLLGAGNATYSLEPFAETYFNQEYVLSFEQSRSKLLIWICWIVVFLITFTAGFNFFNLFIIGLASRDKEIGMRKILGASKPELGVTLGIEVALYVMISFLLSLALTIELLPFFNHAFNTTVRVSNLANIEASMLITGMVLTIGVLLTISIGYYLWGVDLLHLLEDKFGKKIKVNRAIFTLQFVVAVVLIICSTIVIQQMKYLENKPLGFNRQMMEIPAPDKGERDKLKVLKETLSQYPDLSSNVALSSGNPISGNWKVRYELKDGNSYSPYLIFGDKNILDVMHLQLIKGRSIRQGDSEGKLVNETFIKFFGFEDPIGRKIPGTDDRIVGVVKDFNSVSLKKEIPPYIISYRDNPSSLLIDLSETELSRIMPSIKQSWQQIYPGKIFDYKLIEDELLAKHREDILFYRMIISFTLVSILISCFGLYGIASFTSLQRTKEIGIRKVLGASATSILGLLSLDFLKWIGLAFVIAIPISLYAMNRWLAEFTFRVEPGPGTFLLAGSITLLIVVLTISHQTVSAALANPVESLRSE